MTLWSIIILIGFPISLIVFNEISQRTALPKPRLSKVVRMARDTVLPLVAATLFVHYVMELPQSSVLYRVLFTFAAIASLNALIALFNLAFSSEGRYRVPTLLLDLIRIIMVATGTAVIVASVWEQDLGQLLAALGVGGVVIGLALQGTLSNLFSGLSLLSEQAVKIGDWVRVGETEGQVTRVTWRSLSIRTYEATTVIISNDGLAGSPIEKLTREDGLTELQITVNVMPFVPPETIRRAFMEAGRAVPHTNGEPVVTFEKYAREGIEVEMALLLPDFTKRDTALDAFNSLIWYACQRHNVPLASASWRQYDPRPEELIRGASATERMEMLRASAILPDLPDDMLTSVSALTQYQEWRKGEHLVSRGQMGNGAIFILSGQVTIEAMDIGTLSEIDSLKAGQAYALPALMRRDISPVTLRAIQDCSVLHLQADAAERLMTQDGDFAHMLEELMEFYEADLQEAEDLDRTETRRISKQLNR
ncbi:MAG: mechanosensitive ion channel domain-containing protein [Hyphomonas sp.]